MPVLNREPCHWPEDLFAPDRHEEDLFATDRHEIEENPPPRCWWVLHTRPRAEKALSRKLLHREIAFFLPLHERRRRVQRRLVRSFLPLFPGYVFFCGTEEERRTALETNLVVNCLHVEDQQQLETDLMRVYKLIQSGSPLAPEERLQPGMAAEITSGALAGHRGTVIRRHGGKSLRFVVAVNLLQQGVSVEVDDSMIQPI